MIFILTVVCVYQNPDICFLSGADNLGVRILALDVC